MNKAITNKKKKRKSESLLGMAFFGPALVLLSVFLFIPMLLTLIFSFTDFFALNPDLTHFVGLDNYFQIFQDEDFRQAFVNTVNFVLIIAFCVPVVMSLAVVATLWIQIFSPEGRLNSILGNFGIDPQPFINSSSQALPSIAIMSSWQGMGYQMIIFLGGLQAINPALYEAAEMDHASGWKKFKDITLPELKPLCIFVFITITIGAFRMLVQPMIMTGGGPSHSTYTMVYDIYETGTVNWEIGLASTMSVVFAFFVMILTVIQTIVTKERGKKHGDKKTKDI